MHKNICYAIQYVVKNTPYNSEGIFDVFIHRKRTQGFWSMEICFNGKHSRFCTHLIEIAKTIGLFYGETLSVTVELDVNKKPYKIILS